MSFCEILSFRLNLFKGSLRFVRIILECSKNILRDSLEFLWNFYFYETAFLENTVKFGAGFF